MLRNNHPEHSRGLGQFTKKVSRGTDGHFNARGDLGSRAGKHLPAAVPSCWEEPCSSLGFPKGVLPAAASGAKMVLLCSSVQLLCHGRLSFHLSRNCSQSCLHNRRCSAAPPQTREENPCVRNAETAQEGKWLLPPTKKSGNSF